MTNTYNPIVAKVEIPRSRPFRRLPIPEPGVALVLCREGQPPVTLWPEDRITAGEARWGNYRVAYKVDVTEHSFTFDCTLPCESDAFDFQAQVQVTCSVSAPALIVERNVTDVRSVLQPLIVRTMRSISRDYDVIESAAAERAIREAIGAESHNIGLELNRFVVKLSLDEEARAHIRDLRQIERDKAREKTTAELERQRDGLVDFYAPVIREGQWQLLALQLTNHPEDVANVEDMLRQQRQTDMEQQLKALVTILTEDALEGFRMEEAGKRVLRRLLNTLAKELGSETSMVTTFHGPVCGPVHAGSGDVLLLDTRIRRYSDVSFPSHTIVKQTEALRVAVTLAPISEQAVELALEPPSDEEVAMKVDACLVVSPMDFDLQSPNVQSIEVPLAGDSAPVIFKLVPKSVGRKTIGVEFFQDTRYLGQAEVETTVGEKSRESHPVSAHSALALRPQQLAPDLTIYIEEAALEKERRLYRFLLLSPIHELNLNFEEAGEIELQAPPEVYFEELFAELNDWLGERDADDLFFKRLSSLGADLYDQLFPEKLKRIYWEKLRDKVETVQIISADPWIPWELVRPYHPETLEEDDFLCEQFALTRWLAGSSSPDVIDLQKLALVVAASDLSAAADEAEALRKLPGIEVKDVSPSLLDVYDLLETGGFQGLHFACHGEYDRQNPDQSTLLLEAGQRFRPNDIAGKKRTFGRDEPLVFLNACETGRAGLSLTGLGGWAKAFIGAGAGGFVGSTWQAHDESAYKFAVTFYLHLLAGETIAEAARVARRAIRRVGDPTWLSYTVYANPLARLAVKTEALA